MWPCRYHHSLVPPSPPQHFITGSGAKDGIVVAWGEWGSPLAMLLLAWVFVPFYLASAVFTMPQYEHTRCSFLFSAQM